MKATKTLLGVCLALICLVGVGGCSNKGRYAGKVSVVVSDQLQAQGVSLVDWRFSESQKSFGVKLRTNSPMPKQTYVTLSGPGIGRIGSPIPVGERINQGDWIDFGGSNALGNPFANFPDSGTITIDVR
jgi:hypothetical protein